MRYLFVLLVACSSKSPAPAPPQPVPADSAAPTVMTKEQCEAQGGRINASIGGGDQAHCAADETDLGPVRFGIEGGWCCKKT